VNEQVRNRWVASVRELTSQLSERELKELSQIERLSQIEIVLDKKGQFVRSHIYKSSGFPDLDQVAIVAFKDAAPFPNPPREMIEQDGYLHLHYGFMVQFAPQRWVGAK